MHDDTHLTGLNASAQQPRNHIDFASASAFPRVEEGLQAHGDDETVFKKDKRLTKGQIRKLEDEFYKGILVPRQYQLELFERAKKSNIIAVMDTGTGKTLIACLLIRHILSLEYERFPPPLPTTTISVTFKARSTMTKQIPLIRSMQGYVSHDIRNLTAQIHFDSTANAKDAAETFRKENLKIVYVKEKSDTGCSQEETKRVDANGKPIKKRVIFFLVPTVPLVFQQKDYLNSQLAGEVQALCGDLQPGAWDEKQWRKTVEEKDIICCTPSILLQALIHAFIRISDIALLVFDEAHNACGDHPYSVIMREHYRTIPDGVERPRIFGLTASPLNSDREARLSLSELEWTMNATAVTMMHDEISRYASRPSPTLRYYHRETPEPPSMWYYLRDQYKRFPYLEKPLIETYKILKNLGSWCCIQSLWSTLRQIERDIEKSLARNLVAALHGITTDTHTTDAFTEMLLDCKSRFPETTPTPSDCSPKIRLLLTVLGEYRSDPSFCGIVFVQRRFTADLLGQLLGKVGDMRRFLRVGVLMGHSVNDVLRNSMKMTEQYQAVRDFRKGKLNLLVATKVAEEGLDIQACNLVIRLDMDKGSMNLVNYIQSRGRARDPNAKFVLLMEENNIEHRGHQLNLQRREQEIRDVLRANALKLEKPELVDDAWAVVRQQAPPYAFYVEKTGATVTLASAVGMLYYFCAMQVVDDVGSQAVPQYVLTLLAGETDEPWMATVILPATVPMEFRHINGRPMRSKLLAERMAAYEAIKVLYKQGLLDDYLMPMPNLTRRRIKYGDEEYIARTEQEKRLKELKSKKRKRNHKAKVADSLLRPWVADEGLITVYLHVLHTTAADGSPTAMPLGFLAVNPMPVPEMTFPIWPLLAQVDVHIDKVPTPIQITEAQLRQFRRYHYLILQPIIKHFHETSAHAYLVVPISVAPNSPPCDIHEPNLIDWQALHDATHFNSRMAKYALSSADAALDYVIQDPRHYDRKFIPLEFCTGKGPFDPVPFSDEHYQSAADGYRKVNKKLYIDENDTVIRAKLVSRKVNMLAFFNIAHNELVNAKELGDVFLLPQFCQVYPIKTWIMESATLLPSIFFFLELYYKTHELRTKISINVDIQSLLTAITAPSATMQFNYERFETLGDSFLKLALTLHCFVAHPLRSEGLLSMYMSQLQSNHELFKAGMRCGVAEYVVATKLSRTTWAPATIPDSTPSTPNTTTTQNPAKKAIDTTQLLSDKQIADVIEAILGACVHQNSTDPRIAAQALHNIYSNAFNVDWKDYIKAVRLSPRPSEMRDGGRITVDRVQKLFGYEFKDPFLLLEAFTHPTSADRTVNCYQRLEFLGDAVLGFCAVRLFFYRYPDLQPGGLVDLKDAAVNNAFLACVAANLGLHRYIDHFSSALSESITDYCEDLYSITKSRKALPPVVENSNILPSERAGSPTKTRLEEKAELEEKQREVQYWLDLEAPKTISDIYEAVLGAIFLDSGFEVEQVWEGMKRTWLPWVDAYINPSLISRHPYREMAVHLRKLGCDAWRVPCSGDPEDGGFIARLMMHKEIVSEAKGPSRKLARKYLAEQVLEV